MLNAYSVPSRGIASGRMFSLMQEEHTGARGNVSTPQSPQRPPMSVARPLESTSSASPHRNGRVLVEGSGAAAMTGALKETDALYNGSHSRVNPRLLGLRQGQG